MNGVPSDSLCVSQGPVSQFPLGRAPVDVSGGRDFSLRSRSPWNLERSTPPPISNIPTITSFRIGRTCYLLDVIGQVFIQILNLDMGSWDRAIGYPGSTRAPSLEGHSCWGKGCTPLSGGTVAIPTIRPAKKPCYPQTAPRCSFYISRAEFLCLLEIKINGIATNV